MPRHRICLVLALGALGATAAFVVPHAAGAPQRRIASPLSTSSSRSCASPRCQRARPRFALSTAAEASHDFKIAGKKTRLLSTGARATLTVTLVKGRRYPYVCTVPGHTALGMKGTVIAK